MKLKLPEHIDRVSLATRLFAALDADTTDLAPATMEIDPRIYTDPELAQRERDEIFASVPVIAAHGSEIPSPNDFMTVQLPNNEALVVRQPDGSVRTFVNVCRHRGARLVEAAAGSKRVFSCLYHGWSYNPDGALRSITHANTFGDVRRECLGLVELPTEVRHGFVWVVDSPEATIDVGEWLGPEMDASLGSFDLDGYVCYRRGDFDEPINWKTLMDGFVDAYHIKTTHAKSVAPYFHNNVKIWDELGRHSRSVSARKSIDKVRSMPPDEAPIDRHITLAHYVMPNINVLRQPDHFQLLSFLPHPFDVNRAYMSLRLLVPQPVATDDERALWDKNWDILMAVLRDEDMTLNRSLQRAVRNRDVRPFVLGRNEVANQSFHRWYRRALDDPRHWG